MNYEESLSYLHKHKFVDRNMTIMDRKACVALHESPGYLRVLPKEINNIVFDYIAPPTEFIPITLPDKHIIVIENSVQAVLFRMHDDTFYILERINEYKPRQKGSRHSSRPSLTADGSTSIYSSEYIPTYHKIIGNGEKNLNARYILSYNQYNRIAICPGIFIFNGIANDDWKSLFQQRIADGEGYCLSTMTGNFELYSDRPFKIKVYYKN